MTSKQVPLCLETCSFNNANYLLPYTGVGSGIQRSLETGLDVQFENNEKSREFLVTIYRHTKLESSQETDKSNQDKAKKVTKKPLIQFKGVMEN